MANHNNNEILSASAVEDEIRLATIEKREINFKGRKKEVGKNRKPKRLGQPRQRRQITKNQNDHIREKIIR